MHAKFNISTYFLISIPSRHCKTHGVNCRPIKKHLPSFIHNDIAEENNKHRSTTTANKNRNLLENPELSNPQQRGKQYKVQRVASDV